MKSQLKSISTKSFAVFMTAGLLSASVLTGCKAQKNSTNRAGMNKTQKGATAGAAGGALLGGVIGNKYAKGNTVLGAIIGATVGGAAGAVIGRKMDKQAEEIKRNVPNAQVERVGEGIKITFGSDILFDVDSYALRAATKDQLEQFAKTLKTYEDTEIRIEGHADASGSDSYNKTLSQRRAKAVGDYLESLGIRSVRVNEVGYGEEQPVADNSTEAGRAQNRRVDIGVFADKKMQKDARDGKIQD